MLPWSHHSCRGCIVQSWQPGQAPVCELHVNGSKLSPVLHHQTHKHTHTHTHWGYNRAWKCYVTTITALTFSDPLGSSFRMDPYMFRWFPSQHSDTSTGSNWTRPSPSETHSWYRKITPTCMCDIGREFSSGHWKAKNAVTARLYKVNGRLVTAVRDAVRGPSIFSRGLFGLVDAIFR